MTNHDQFLSVRDILNRYDPMGIIMGDENIDEYDPEAKEIISLLLQHLSVDELTQKIHEIFVRYFDSNTAGEKNKYNPIAKEIALIK